MVNLDVILEKINSVQNCLQRIHHTVGKDINVIDTLDGQDIVVLNLQRAIQQVLDIAAHVVSTENLGVPQTLKETFRLLEKNKIISSKISGTMQKMIGFRNIAVHNYGEIDGAILRAIITKNLTDFEEFYTAVLKHYKE